MKKYEKLLQKLNGKSRDLVIEAMERLITGDTISFNIVKLRENLFRVRVGNYRIFFHYEGKGVRIDDVRKRNEGTYRDV